MNGQPFTQEMDRFISDMVGSGMTYAELVPVFNEKFNDNRSWTGLAQHGFRIGATYNRYTTEEQREWIKEHFYVEGHDLVRLFNKRFGTDKDYRFIRNQRQKLHAHRNRRKSE